MSMLAVKQIDSDSAKPPPTPVTIMSTPDCCRIRKKMDASPLALDQSQRLCFFGFPPNGVSCPKAPISV